MGGRHLPVGEPAVSYTHLDVYKRQPPPGTQGTVRYVDAMGQIGVEWDTGSSLSLIPGKDHFHKEAPKKSRDEVGR